MSDRYDGQPLLRLLELYVLWSIAELPKEEEDALQRMAPKLGSIYGTNETWQAAIEAAMQMPPAMPELLRELWEKNTDVAARGGAVLDPQKFAEMAVDTNFVS